MKHLPFRQVDVFSTEVFRGNPVAVVHGADGLDDETLRAFAAWTNLSETTFLLEPTHPEADYRVRIFTVDGELPFAGHPTLGTAHAWLEAGGVPRGTDVVQQCEAGLVTVRRGEVLAFSAPPLVRTGALSAGEVQDVASALGLEPTAIRAAEWIDNGPGWVGLLLADADAVLDVEVDPTALGDWKVGLVGEHSEQARRESGCTIEVRALFGSIEDPVTGSLNAGLAQWLIGVGVLPASYVASQGTRLGRRGRVHVSSRDGDVWVGGVTQTVVSGQVAMPSLAAVDR